MGTVITGGAFRVNSALGLSIVPPADSATAPSYALRSQDFGVRAGFLPGYPTDQSAMVATVPDQQFTQRLPFIFGLGRLVRGGC